jgi:GNAT superfamily N-acetyltransferase
VPTPAVRLAIAPDRERIVATVQAAFASDPAFRYFFPGDDEYAALAPVFIGQLLDQRLARGTAWVVADGAAVALWSAPGAVEEPVTRLPADVTARLRTFDAAVHHHLPADPHWYLGMLATHPDHAGQGWGRLAMSAGLARAEQDGRPSYLETVTPVNVRIYQSSGWQVTDTVAVAGLDVSILRHD